LIRFWWPWKINTIGLYVDMILHEIHDCHFGCNGRNTENTFKKMASLFGRQTVSASLVTDDKYGRFGRVLGAVQNSELCVENNNICWGVGGQTMARMSL